MTPHDGRGEHPAAASEPLDDTTTEWADVARRIARGDSAAETLLAERFRGRAYALALAHLKRVDIAEDLAQDTILAVVRALRAGQLREVDKLPAFVLGTARNLINNRLRKRGHSQMPAGDEVDSPADGDPTEAAIAREQQDLIRAALRRVNALDRRILLLTLVEAMHPREIAPIVGLSAEAVRTRKSRAIQAVADEVDRLTRIPRPGHMATGEKD